MHLKTLCSILLMCIGHDAYADTTMTTSNTRLENSFSKPKPFFKYDFFKHLKQKKKQITDTETAIEIASADLNQEQKKLAEEHEQELKNYSVLSNQFYEDGHFKVFNYTAFTTDDFKSRVSAGQSIQQEVQGLNISVGYGMEFKINKTNTLGYEYLSSFPYDRGQMVRLYWVKAL
ncbi:hypothetical protein DJ533_06740 [Acinetobacter defluvii]|uniref:Uncharacterized protein n=1 Tax=Acinetobacter defluvii TaxID=1871111 RepID=A0A2S2FBD9_9GAMM|nr:hypothetical protein [Acinetobacter defluvii]AWL28287.1 hypothetical protein DJ533_06740 [Acinetobacter defluvii]